MDLDLEFEPELDPAALEVLPAETGLTGGCEPTCNTTWQTIGCKNWTYIPPTETP